MPVDRTSSPEFPASRIVSFIGPPGSGKTYRSLERWRKFPRCIAIDVRRIDGLGEYPGIVVRSPAELAASIRRNVDKPRWRIVYRGPRDVPDGLWTLLAHVPNYLLTVDETDIHTTASRCPDGLFSIAHHGRTAGQALTLACRRPANVSRDLTAVSDEIWSWPLDEPADIRAMKERGFDPEWWAHLPRYAAVVRVRKEGEPSRFYRALP